MNKEQQKQHITDIMNEDAKDGLYRQQTSIDWLANQILKLEGINNVAIPDDLFQKARQMHREEIEKANIAGMEFIPVDPNRYKSDASDYYTQIYGE